MNKSLIVSLGIVFTAVLATWKGCKYDWNPHYASNRAVHMGSSFYNSDSSAAVVDYELDVGARGLRYYQTLLKKGDYEEDLSRFMLPAEYVEPKWRAEDTLEVIYDERAAFLRGSNITDVHKGRDTVVLNGIVVVVKERRMNKRKGVDDFMKANRLK
ncbi:MAG: hypothetical protein ACRYF0_16005 [Janthinobacterium lividum]